MTRKFSVGVAMAQAVVLGMLLTAALAARGGEKVLADDKCLSQCDADSDKCMLAAGKDKEKQAACDKIYDKCLASCNN